VNVGLPIGAITMWAVADPPPGWLICDGQAFDAGVYPELAAVLGVTNVPDLRGQFIRGANGTTNPLNSQQQWTTGLARSGFRTAVDGDHTHVYSRFQVAIDNGQRIRADNNDGGYRNQTTTGTGAHTHVVTGGDAETAPDHYCLHYIVKATDIQQRVRI
jgi:microcystin-dependent protein